MKQGNRTWICVLLVGWLMGVSACVENRERSSKLAETMERLERANTGAEEYTLAHALMAWRDSDDQNWWRAYFLDSDGKIVSREVFENLREKNPEMPYRVRFRYKANGKERVFDKVYVDWNAFLELWRP